MSLNPLWDDKLLIEERWKKNSMNIPSLPPNSCQSCHVLSLSFSTLLKTYQMPGLVLVPLFALSHCFLTISLWKRDFLHCFIKEEIGNESDLGPQSLWTAEPSLLITQLHCIQGQEKWRWIEKYTEMQDSLLSATQNTNYLTTDIVWCS